MTDIQKSI